ncbi:hypothetical protein [Rhizobium sp. BK176]|uniref:hypothetical protein n=1 Tax=Rhizobium sp. BK176 TaxID=2587071 RepID=UPI00216A1A83|nr:hypothetical protein [Rhizobium sp. BK176]MCS4088973.1 hypothetical protein [Rhizobium sp. BK176]
MAHLIDAAVIRKKTEADTAYIANKSRYLDMWWVGLVGAGFIAGAVAYLTEPLLASPFAGVCAALALGIFHRASRIRLARARVNNAWKSALPTDLHTAAGEPVKFVAFIDEWRGVVVSHQDGSRVVLPWDGLENSRGEVIVNDGEGQRSFEAARLKRWSAVKWKTDDGRVGTLRGISTALGYESSYDVTTLTLKMEDGSEVQENINLLTPVAR